MFVCVGPVMVERVSDPGCCLKKQHCWDSSCGGGIEDSAKQNCCLAPAAIGAVVYALQ